MRNLLLLAAMILCVNVVRAEADGPAVFEGLNRGFVAFCHPSEIDELQIIGKPRKLTADDAKSLSEILAAKDSWYTKGSDGEWYSYVTYCIPHYDFKLLFADAKDHVVAMRLCSYCRQVEVIRDDVRVELPNLTSAGMAGLSSFFDDWFPDWTTITKENQAEWFKRK